MMRTFGLAVIPIICVLLTGCDGEITTSAPPPSDVTTGTGNWFIFGYYDDGGGYRPYSLGGSLVNHNGQLTGVFHINQPCFGSGATDIPYTGAVDAKNNISITSSPVNGQVLKLTGTLSAAGSIMNDANFGITGGCTGNITSVTTPNGPGAEIETTAVRVPSLNGTWSSSSSQSGLSISEQLTQAATPDGHGDYALTGTATVQGSPCFSHGTIESTSFVSGSLGRERIVMADGSILDATLQVGYGDPPSTKPTLLLYPGSITAGSCDSSIDLSLQ